MLENMRLERGCNILTLQLEKTEAKLDKTQDRLAVALVAALSAAAPSAIAPSVAPAPPVVALVAAFLLFPSPTTLSSNDGLISSSTMPSATESVSSKKLIKLSDPLVLTDGIDPLFNHWLAKMQNKLCFNIDHYSIEVLRMNYIKNQYDGVAMGHLAPRRCPDFLRPFSTS